MLTVWRPDEPPENERFFTRSEMAQVLNAIARVEPGADVRLGHGMPFRATVRA